MKKIDELEERIETLEESQSKLLDQIERLTDTVDDINRNQMSNQYIRWVKEGNLEEMRKKHPEEVEEYEQIVQNHITDILQNQD